MYFDAVLDRQMRPVFNGTPEETKTWLLNNLEDPDMQNLHVCEGKTLKQTNVYEYLGMT